jgi:hypothetical protein
MKTSIPISVLLLLMLPICLRADVPLTTVDTERLKEALPQGWIVKQVKAVDSPMGWKTTKGGKGLRVSFENPTRTVHDPMVGDYHPMYSFTLMPLNWEGKNILGGEFTAGQFTEEKSDKALQAYPDRFRKTFQTFHYFESYLGRGDWVDPFKDIVPLLENIEIL